MYDLLSILTGALIAGMIVLNGELTVQYGVYHATLIIHCVGLVATLLGMCCARERIFHAKRLPWYLYTGGVIGVATTVFNNLAFATISVSAIVALSLLGQSVTSVLIDQYGLGKAKKQKMHSAKRWGMALVALGAILLLGNGGR